MEFSSSTNTLADMRPTRVGFIGLSTQGWASAALADPLFDPLLSSSYTLTALCTTSEESATKAAEKYTELARRTVKAYYGDEGLRAIANDPEVDLVAVSVKISDHYKAVMPAIEAGKDVFIEWAVGKSYEETVRIAEAAKRKGVRVLVGAQGIQNKSLKKVKELIDSGKIGRILSTSAILTSPAETQFWGNVANQRSRYAFDNNNGATVLTIPVGHFLSVLTEVLGDFTEVTASGVIQFNPVSFVDADGNSTGETVEKTTYDQIALIGRLQPKGSEPGIFVSLHCRGGLPSTEEYGRGRTLLKWVIDGEFGTIEVQNNPDHGAWPGAFIAIGDKRIFLNGEEVSWETTEADRLGNSGKAWLEFAKGSEGRYWGIDDSLKLHRLLDATLTSIQEGKRIIL